MISKNRHIMMVAGEPSGDFYGAMLINQLKQRDPFLKFSGIGGDRMKHQGMEIFFHCRFLSAMGVTEVIAQLGVIQRAFRKFRQQIIKEEPDLLILIDYPGFNMKAAGFAKKNNISVLYYITPKVWAWKKSRLKTLKRNIDHAVLIFPFEIKLYQRAGIPFTFVGHPLLDVYPESDIVKPSKDRVTKIIGLLPGSRASEIKSLLEILLETAKKIQGRIGNIKFLVSAAESVDLEMFEPIVEKYNQDRMFTIVRGSPRQIFSQSDFLIAASGTVTLEAALCGIPMIIVYKVSRLTYVLARRFVNLTHAGLANIIAGREIVPELLQDDAAPDRICNKAVEILNPTRLSSMRKDLMLVRNLLGGPGASRRAAVAALELMATSTKD